MEEKWSFQRGYNAKMHFQRGFKSLPEGSITQIFLHSRGVKVPKAEVLDRGGLVFKCNSPFVNRLSFILFHYCLYIIYRDGFGSN